MRAVLPKLTEWSVKTATRYAAIRTLSPKDEPDLIDISDVEQELEELSIEDFLSGYQVDSSEIRKIQEYLDKARSAWAAGNKKEAKEALATAISASNCDRCKRGMERILESEEDVEHNLAALSRMIPVYYTIMHEEEENNIDDLVSRDESGEGANRSRSRKVVMVQSCEACAATEVLKLCNFDDGCMNAILEWVDAQKKAGKSVFEEDLLNKAREYDGMEGTTKMEEEGSIEEEN